MRLLSVLLGVCAFACGSGPREASIPAAPEQRVSRGMFVQRLVPDDPVDGRTFRQRYLIDSTYASGPDAPVLYFLGNEGDLDMLVGTAGYIGTLARVLGAHLVALEHRYYGDSIPVATLTADTLRPLTIEYALADFARFEQHVRDDLGLRGTWIAIGRSYGASLATFYRAEHPDLVAGAIAAAPALLWHKTVREFDERLARQAGPQCVRAYHQKILGPIEAELAQHRSLGKLKQLYGAQEITDDDDFLNALGQTVSFLLQMKGPRSLCPLLAKPDPAPDVAAALLAFMREEHMSGLIDFTDQGMRSPDARNYTRGIGTRQWAYQSCTEFGGASPPPSDPDHTFQSTALFGTITDDSECEKLFGIRARTEAEIEAIDARFYGPLLGPDSTASHILVLNDEDDPTAVLSISDENHNHTNPRILVHTVAHSAHHEEFNTPAPNDPPSFRQARELVVATARAWLAGK